MNRKEIIIKAICAFTLKYYGEDPDQCCYDYELLAEEIDKTLPKQE